jgi:O-succinylbenzoic acid--CoA ligase
MNIPASSGYPLPITRVRITSDDGPAPPGEPGQIEIAGPTLFSGYLAGTGPLTHTTSDGWFRTGDLGYMDAHGALYVVDRRDDLIVSGGENVYPAEIERVLLEHPLVRDAGVVGLPHAQWGARPAAAVVWDGDARSAEHDLRQHCAPRLARFKIPDRITVLARLPRSASGKLLRRELRHLLDTRTRKAEADASPDLAT